MKEITSQQIKQIRNFLVKNPSYFADNKNEADATLLNDAFYFKIENPTNLIYWNELCICDIYARELWVVRHVQKKKYDKIRKEKLDIEPVAFILKIDDALYHQMTTFNGNWKITKAMLKK